MSTPSVMFSSVYLKTLHDSRRGFMGWSLGVVALVVTEGAVWPSMRSVGNLEQVYQSLPEELRKLFNIGEMTSGLGFMNAELFTLMLPLLFIIRSVALGARAVAGEEEGGTLDLLLVTPLSGARLVAEKAAALLTEMVALTMVLLGSTLGASELFGLRIGFTDAAAGCASCLLLGVEFGAVALAVGAWRGRRAEALGAASLAAVGAYVLYAMGLLVDAVQPWRPMSPFDQALSSGPLGGGFPRSYLWLVAGTAVLTAVALPLLDRRDVAARS